MEVAVKKSLRRLVHGRPSADLLDFITYPQVEGDRRTRTAEDVVGANPVHEPRGKEHEGAADGLHVERRRELVQVRGAQRAAM
eukprot:CAMPEP_0174728362 /NCGR_PEP_ID=MMETSP1094-20130205/51596_1 /TAXON_ID=156173 /ORGANISM="Chrysochromulina brevifilum, Strain UTEX LB 985" /LENGTH=82 /DNA_ID=CAMNT_0015930261 /DNA_START=307 /DNA_END=555 /DNA_ORIENTATION=+